MSFSWKPDYEWGNAGGGSGGESTDNDDAISEKHENKKKKIVYSRVYEIRMRSTSLAKDIPSNLECVSTKLSRIHTFACISLLSIVYSGVKNK